MMHGRQIFRGFAVTTVAMALLLQTPGAAAPAVSRGQRQFCFTSFSYGTRVLVGSTVTSAPSSPSQIGCTSRGSIARSNTSSHAHHANNATTGSLNTTARTSMSPVSSQSLSVVHNVSVLAGAITASLVRASSTTRSGPSGFALSDAGTLFTSLRVEGKRITRPVRPNTRMALPGLGFVVLDQESRSTSSLAGSLVIDAIHAVVTTANGKGIAPNTNVLIGHAMSALEGPVDGLLAGDAYGTSHTSGNESSSGQSFLNPMPCLGTKGRLFARSGAGVQEPGVLSSGTVRNSVRGTVSPTEAVGTLTASVQDANLLAGIVQASLIRAGARVEKDAGSILLSDPGSSFGSLKVAGHPEITARVPANTKVLIPGVGILYLHRIIRTSQSIEVRMIELVMSARNRLGLPAGTDLRVAVAKAGIR